MIFILRFTVKLELVKMNSQNIKLKNMINACNKVVDEHEDLKMKFNICLRYLTVLIIS